MFRIRFINMKEKALLWANFPKTFPRRAPRSVEVP